MRISSLSDLKKIRASSVYTNNIEIDGVAMYRKGLLKHSLYYSINKTETGGSVCVICSPGTGYGRKKSTVYTWQIVKEIKSIFGSDVAVKEINAQTGEVVVEKLYTRPEVKTVTVGVVYSGQLSELPLLESQLSSLSCLDPSEIKLQIYILTNEGSCKELYDIETKYPSLSISVDEYKSLVEEFDISRKKNYMFNRVNSDILVICHSRILFPRDFLQVLSGSCFDVCAPQVVFQHEKKEYPYLDFLLIDSYDTSRPNSRSTISCSKYEENYLALLNGGVPYIDGGVVVIDRRRISVAPYNDLLNWGEAEDVDMCGRLFNEGFLIDYLFEIKCVSQTNKLDFSYRYFFSPGRIIQDMKNRYSVIKSLIV